MKTLILRDLVENSSSNVEGMVLYTRLKSVFLQNKTVLLEVDSDQSLSSSFLNSSIGAFLEDYGYSTFKKTVKFKGSKTQFEKLNNYITKYRELYLA